MSSPTRTELRIIEAALAALARVGTRKLTMSDVIEEAGVARGTLYRYFANKDALLLGVADHVRDVGIGNLRAAVENCPDPADRFDVVASVILGTDWFPPNSMRLLETEPAFALGFLREVFPWWLGEVSALFADAADHLPGVADGELTVEELAEVLLRLSVAEWLVPPTADRSLVGAARAFFRHPAPNQTDG